MAVGDAGSADQSILWDGMRLNYPTKRSDPRPEVCFTLRGRRLKLTQQGILVPVDEDFNATATRRAINAGRITIDGPADIHGLGQRDKDGASGVEG